MSYNYFLEKVLGFVFALLVSHGQGICTTQECCDIAEEIDCEETGCAFNSNSECTLVTKVVKTYNNGTCYCNDQNVTSVGDCECEKFDGFGQNKITVVYTGSEPASRIDWYEDDNKNPDLVCSDWNVNPGDEITCDITKFNNGEYSDFNTNTFFFIYGTHYPNGVCEGSFHTSCSRDILYQRGEDCEDLICTGWGQYNPSKTDCEDGFDKCDCDTGNYINDTDPEIIVIGDRCYCPDNNTIVLGGNYGDCNCDKDYKQQTITVRYEANVFATNIEFYYDGIGTDVICSFDDVQYGEEIFCDVTDFNNGEYTKFDTNTYFTITSDFYQSGSCYGSFHTSCSRDILYTNGADCPELFCTAWADGNPNTPECNDGFTECDCDTSTMMPDTTQSESTAGPQPSTTEPESSTTEVDCESFSNIEDCEYWGCTWLDDNICIAQTDSPTDNPTKNPIAGPDQNSANYKSIIPVIFGVLLFIFVA